MEPDAGPGARDGDDGAAWGWSEREWSVAGPPGHDAALAWLETAWTGEDPFVAGSAQDETAGAWLAATEGSEALEGGVDEGGVDEAEIWPALAAIIPAVISAAPAVIDAVKQLTRPKPSPAPPRAAPPPPRPPTPARPAPPTRPVPVSPPPRQTAVPRPAPVPRPTAPPPAASGPAPSGAGGAADTVELLRLLAGLLPQLTALLSGPTAREWIEAAEHEVPWDDADPGERLAEQLPCAPPGSEVAGRSSAGRSPISTEQAGTEHAVAEQSSAGHAPGEGAERESDAAASSEGQDERGPPAVERSPADVATVADGAAQDGVTQDGVAHDGAAITDLVPLPDRSTINVGVSPCPTSLLVSRFGRPRDLVTAECQAITSPFWEGRMTTGRVGTFRVRGHHRAVALLAEAFAALEATDPDLHARVGSSGMLCVRHVRGRPGVLSNHALGLALDVTIDGRTDIRGDDQVQRGLLRLHEVLAPFGVFWGAGVRPEDAIHFEIGAELVHRWLEEGSF